MQPRILLPIAALGLVLAAPAAANAAVTPALNGNTLTLTGDDTNDNFTLDANADGNLQHSFGSGANGLKDNTDFDVDPNVEKTLKADGTITVVVDAQGGNDNVNLQRANLAGATISGGAGDDIIVGSNALDTISGGDGNDRITGFRGDETINGDAGNDVMIWQNGDGDDINIGGAGADETSIVTGTGDDNMTVSPNGARIRIERGFTVDMETVERLAIQSFSGNDTLTTQPGIALPMVIDAGSGDDTITTGDGADLIDGGDGNDSIQLRENVADFVRGGPGADTATVDALDAVAADVETVDRPAAQPPAKAGAPKVTLRVNVKRNVAAVKLACPAGVSECKGSVTLKTAKGKVKTVGKANYTLQAGEKKTLRIKLAKGTAKLAKNKKLTVKARVTSGAGRAKTAKLTLRFR
jgi:Ca2+-binding RTX toxin-like protein